MDYWISEPSLQWPDTRAGLAVEDRDLKAEADDLVLCFASAQDVHGILYPVVEHIDGEILYSPGLN
jgi:hypothetical protein